MTSGGSRMRRVDEALSWMFQGGDGELQSNPFRKFPDLSHLEMLERVLYALPHRGDDGVFRDAAETVFCCAASEARDQVLPRVRDLIADRTLTLGARSLAYQLWTDTHGDKGLPPLPAEELESIFNDYCASTPLSTHGSIRRTSEFHCDFAIADGPDQRSLEASEAIRALSGTPYALAYYLALRYDTPWRRETADALARTGCVTTTYLLRLGLEHAADQGDAVACDLYRRAIEDCERHAGESAEVESWFRPAKFWLSARDLEQTAYLLAWIPTMDPAGTLVMVGAGPQGLENGYCERRVPEASIPEQEVMDRPLTPADPRVVLSVVREGFAAWARRHPPTETWWMPDPELDAAVLLEHAAVQTIATFAR